MCVCVTLNSTYVPTDLLVPGVDSTVGIKSKRRYAGGPGKHVYPLYQKLTEVVDVLAQLLHSQSQPDTFVLQVRTYIRKLNSIACAYIRTHTHTHTHTCLARTHTHTHTHTCLARTHTLHCACSNVLYVCNVY